MGLTGEGRKHGDGLLPSGGFAQRLFLVPDYGVGGNEDIFFLKIVFEGQ